MYYMRMDEKHLLICSSKSYNNSAQLSSIYLHFILYYCGIISRSAAHVDGMALVVAVIRFCFGGQQPSPV